MSIMTLSIMILNETLSTSISAANFQAELFLMNLRYFANFIPQSYLMHFYSNQKRGDDTLSIMTFSLMTLGIIIFRLMTLSIETFSLNIQGIMTNRTAHIRHLCRIKTVLSCHRCLINTGVEKMFNI
jgi:hypothetical protein